MTIIMMPLASNYMKELMEPMVMLVVMIGNQKTNLMILIDREVVFKEIAYKGLTNSYNNQ